LNGFLLDTTPLTGLFQGKSQIVRIVEPWLEARIAHTTLLSVGEATEYFLGPLSPSAGSRRSERSSGQ
jgi:hypothetical protein